MASTPTPSRGRRRQQPDETRTLILDTAERLLRERPFRELGVDEIMRSTGYGRTVFYRHFTGLPDLTLAVLGRVLPTFLQANEAFLAAAGDEIDHARARAILRPVVEHWRTHGPLLRALRDAAVYDAEIDAIVLGAQRGPHATTVAALERRQAAGFLADADLEQLADALAAMTQRYLIGAYGDPDQDVPVDVVADTLARVWVATLTSP